MTPSTQKIGPIRVGDLVVLRSGGPVLTVERIEPLPLDTDVAHCAWFAGKTLQTGRIPLACLQHASVPLTPENEPPRALQE